MQITFIAASLSSLLVGFISFSAISSVEVSAEQNKAVLSCEKLAKAESKNWVEWSSQKGISSENLYRYTFSMCLNAVATARDAKSIVQLSDWEVDAFNRNSYFGYDALNVKAVQQAALIAKDFYNSSHGKKNQYQKSDVSYPDISNTSTEGERVAALKDYSSKKTINGITIKDRCEVITKKMPDGSTPSFDVRSNAMISCEGVMVMNVTQGKHGIAAEKVKDLSLRAYGQHSMEYRYMEQVTKSAFSESR
ncbi:hypothetical protein ACI09M_003763 [Cronobacter dublinensis]